MLAAAPEPSYGLQTTCVGWRVDVRALDASIRPSKIEKGKTRVAMKGMETHCRHVGHIGT